MESNLRAIVDGIMELRDPSESRKSKDKSEKENNQRLRLVRQKRMNREIQQDMIRIRREIYDL